MNEIRTGCIRRLANESLGGRQVGRLVIAELMRRILEWCFFVCARFHFFVCVCAGVTFVMSSEPALELESCTSSCTLANIARHHAPRSCRCIVAHATMALAAVRHDTDVGTKIN